MSEAKLIAEFEMDQNSRPAYIADGNKVHYKIWLSLLNVPSWCTLATYRLHPTYRNSVREVSRGTPRFKELITAYGDFEVFVNLFGDETERLPPVLLSGALEEQYTGNNDPAIRQAIDTIKRN
jgi:hypothetical protein